MNYKAKIEAQYNEWKKEMERIKDSKNILTHILAKELGITKQSVLNKFKGRTAFTAVEKEVLNHFINKY